MQNKDYLIVGSGILGATTAFYLSKQGYQITVVDRDEEGRATKHAAGIICPWIAQRRNQDWYKLARLGARMYPELIAELESEYGEQTSYKKVGALSLHVKEERLEAMIERTEKRKKEAPEIGELIRLSDAEIQSRYPILQEGYEGVLVTGAARINGENFRKALIQASKRNGVNFVNDDVELIIKSDKITGLISKNNSHTYTADQIIITNGAWERELLQKAHLKTKAHAQKAQLVHFDLKNNYDFFEGWPVIKPPNNQYMLFNHDGTITAGTTYERTTEYDLNPSAQGINSILSKAFQAIPALEQATIKRISVGFRPVIHGSVPYFGRLNDQNNHVLLANGLGASGLNTGPFIASILADLAQEKNIKEIDISRYTPDISSMDSLFYDQD